MKRRKALESYVAWLQQTLNLNEWVIRIAKDPATTEDAAAEITTIDGRRLADIALASDFLDTSSPQDIRHYLIHELLHLHHEEVARVVQELQACMSPQEHTLADNLHRHALEVMVDQLAFAWERTLEQTGIDSHLLAKVKT